MHNMTRHLPAAAVAAFLLLSACNQEPEVISPVDPQADELASAPPVVMPASIKSNRTYRCKDNSLLYTVFMTDNTVRVRTEENGPPTVLTAAEGTEGPFVAEGYSLSGDGDTVTFAAPGKPSQSCRA